MSTGAALLATLGALALAGLARVLVRAHRELRAAHRRSCSGALHFVHGTERIEYRRGGTGAPVLVIHGSGGGSDQGELIAAAVLGTDVEWIAPSRLGYLGSTLPVDADFVAQAHAYATLLDHLGLDSVAVLALSHGGPSALQFARLYPQRVSRLVLLSCGVTGTRDASATAAHRRGTVLTAVFRRDLGYWLVSRYLRGPLMRLMGADRDVIATLDPGQRALVDRVIDLMNPVSLRYPGVWLDHTAALPGAEIGAVRAPTLVLHARDDRLQPFHNAAFAAATLPDVRLLAFEHGGHLLFALQRDRIRREVGEFLAPPAHVS